MDRIVVFASGTKDSGGSGFQELVENSRTGVLEAHIVAVVSQHQYGGVRKRADVLGIPFAAFPKNGGAKDYQALVRDWRAGFACLSGWMLLVQGLDPKTTINIHPGPLPEFGGEGMYGIHVHEAVLKAYREGRIAQSAVSMHFVTPAYDQGPVFFEYPVLIRQDDTAETLQGRVSKIEHAWQPFITNLVVQGAISWDGTHPESLLVPSWYPFAQQPALK